MRFSLHRRYACQLFFVVFWALLISLGAAFAAQPLGGEPEVLVCPLLHAKTMPQGLPVAAMKFTGPAGDGRRGSAGFVVQRNQLIKGAGTRWKFNFQRTAGGFGFQVIHPFQKGHILVSVHSRGATIHQGGDWGKVGWGDPGSSLTAVAPNAANALPLKAGTLYTVDSRLTEKGDYHLWINGNLILEYTIEKTEPLLLHVPAEQRVWGGSSWDRTPFKGEGFEPRLEPGHAGLILGPMDGSGPQQFFKRVTLSGVISGPLARKVGETNPGAGAGNLTFGSKNDSHFEPLFVAIDRSRERGQLIRTKAAGGKRGGAFEEIPEYPSVLIGFDFTTSTFFGGHLTIKSARPIFRNRKGESIGKWHGVPHGKVHQIKAEDGYVVSGMIAKSGHRIDGLRLIFMRVKTGRLNPDDSYRSKWIGGLGGGAERLYSGNGAPLVGIYGRQGHDVDAFGFILAGDRD